MKRNDDLFRELLFEFESEPSGFLVKTVANNAPQDVNERNHHIDLLSDAGFVVLVPRRGYRLTNDGHDYLQAIRSDTIWAKTKQGAAEVGGMTLGMMKDLAIAYVKKEASEKLGITL